jgi:hypothetical protein
VGVGLEECRNAALGHIQACLSFCHIFRAVRGITHDSHPSKFVIEAFILSLSDFRTKVNISRIRSPNTTPCPTCNFIVNPLCFRGYATRRFLTIDRR